VCNHITLFAQGVNNSRLRTHGDSRAEQRTDLFAFVCVAKDFLIVRTDNGFLERLSLATVVVQQKNSSLFVDFLVQSTQALQSNDHGSPR
jgi:hypothetical protein